MKLKEFFGIKTRVKEENNYEVVKPRRREKISFAAISLLIVALAMSSVSSTIFSDNGLLGASGNETVGDNTTSFLSGYFTGLFTENVRIDSSTGSYGGLRYNSSEGYLEFSNDNQTTWAELGSGGLRPAQVSSAGTSEVRKIEILDHSTAYVRTLPAATGSGEQVAFQVGNNTNIINVTVQGGENLNGVENGTLQLDTANSYWLFTDVSSGEWRGGVQQYAGDERLVFSAYTSSDDTNFDSTDSIELYRFLDASGGTVFTDNKGIDLLLNTSSYTCDGVSPGNYIKFPDSESFSNVNFEYEAVISYEDGTVSNEAAELVLCLNGVEKSRYAFTIDDANAAYETSVSMSFIEDIPAGSEISIKLANWGASGDAEIIDQYLRMTELDSVTQYAAGTLVAEELHRVHLSGRASSAAIEATGLIDLDSAQFDNSYDPNNLINTGTNAVDIAQSGTYRLRMVSDHYDTGAIAGTILVDAAVVASTVSTSNDAAPLSASVITEIAAGQSVTFSLSATENVRNVQLEVEQLPEKTAIRAEDTPVNDQAENGYLDIGDVRMQWGTILSNDGPVTVNFPQPFANDAGYSVSLTLVQNGTIAGPQGDVGINHWVDAKNTTSFDYDRDDDIDFADIDWIAIGRKP